MDFQKGKRSKRLKELLGGKRSQEAVGHFQRHTFAILALILLVHMTFFITFAVMIKSLNKYAPRHRRCHRHWARPLQGCWLHSRCSARGTSNQQ
jgi:hypothetical protein